MWAYLELALTVVCMTLSYRKGTIEEEWVLLSGLAQALYPFNLSFTPQIVRGDQVGALAYGFSKSILSIVGNVLGAHTCCPLHAHVNPYTADTVARTRSDPTMRHFSLQFVKK